MAALSFSTLMPSARASARAVRCSTGSSLAVASAAVATAADDALAFGKFAEQPATGWIA